MKRIKVINIHQNKPNNAVKKESVRIFKNTVMAVIDTCKYVYQLMNFAVNNYLNKVLNNVLLLQIIKKIKTMKNLNLYTEILKFITALIGLFMILYALLK